MYRTLTERLIDAVRRRLEEVRAIRNSIAYAHTHLMLEELRCEKAVRYLERRFC